jgi:hypothetical protein
MNDVRPRGFLISLLAIYALVAAAIGINYAVLWRTGELGSLQGIILRQAQDGAIYNALSIGFADYKYASYRHAAPQIVAIGTSRAMQIRQSFFRKPFYNLGGLTQGPAQANVLADRLLLRGDPPKLVIFALDFWTFCRPPTSPAYERRIAEPDDVHDGMGQPPRNFLIYRLLLERRFAAADFAQLFLPRSATDVDRIGLGARLGGSGFAADGSNYAIAPPEHPLEPRWSDMLNRIDAGTDKFIKDCAVSDVALEALERFVERMEGAGSHVVLLLAPLPGPIIARMAAEGRYAYLDRLRSVLGSRYGDRFLDVLDMRNSAPDSEFLDGIHGGEVVYMRAIMAAARLPGSALGELVDEKLLAARIDRWHGHAQITDDPINRRFFQ